MVSRSEASGLDVPGQETVRSRLQSASDSVDSDATISIKDGPTVTLGIWVQCENPVIFHRMQSGQYEFGTRAVDRAGESWLSHSSSLKAQVFCELCSCGELHVLEKYL